MDKYGLKVWFHYIQRFEEDSSSFPQSHEVFQSLVGVICFKMNSLLLVIEDPDRTEMFHFP